MDFDEWAVKEIGPLVVIPGWVRKAWDAAIEEAAKIAEAQMTEPECQERAQYCADAIRMLSSNALDEPRRK